MGNVAACKELHSMSNACEMATCIETVQGRASTAPSASDEWIVTFFKKSTKYLHEHQKDANITVWIHADNPNPNSESSTSSVAPAATLGLEYNLRVYRDSIRPLVDFSICPHFVRFFASGQKCKYDMVLAMLKIPETEPENIRRAWARNVAYMRECKPDRPAINDTKTDMKENDDEKESIDAQETYSMLVTENTSKFIPLTEIFHAFSSGDDRVLTLELWQILFQCLCAAYAMSMSRLSHNNFVADNILVERLQKPRNVSYHYALSTFYLSASVCVRVRDFTLSYHEDYGTNLLTYNNGFATILDSLKMLRQFYNICRIDDDRNSILDIAIPNEQNSENLKKMFQDPAFLKSTAYTGEYNSVPKMLLACMKLANVTHTSSLPIQRIYVCHHGMFDTKGNAKIQEKVQINHDYFLAKMKRELEDAKKLHDEFQTLKKAAEIEKKEAENKINKLRTQHDEVSREIQTLTTQNEQRVSNLETLRAEKQKLQSSQNNNTDLNEAVKITRELLEAETNLTKDNNDKIAQLELKRDKLYEEAKLFGAAVKARLQLQRDQLQNAMSIRDADEQRIAVNEIAAENAAEAAAQYDVRMAKYAKSTASLLRDIAKYSVQVEELRDNIKVLEGLQRESEQKLAGLEKEMDILKQSRVTTERDSDELNKTIEELQSEIDIKTIELAALRRVHRIAEEPQRSLDSAIQELGNIQDNESKEREEKEKEEKEREEKDNSDQIRSSPSSLRSVATPIASLSVHGHEEVQASDGEDNHDDAGKLDGEGNISPGSSDTTQSMSPPSQEDDPDGISKDAFVPIRPVAKFKKKSPRTLYVEHKVNRMKKRWKKIQALRDYWIEKTPDSLEDVMKTPWKWYKRIRKEIKNARTAEKKAREAEEEQEEDA